MSYLAHCNDKFHYYYINKLNDLAVIGKIVTEVFKNNFVYRVLNNNTPQD